MIIKVNAPRYFVEVSTGTVLSKAAFHRWAGKGTVSEEGEESGVGRWYLVPFSSIKEARKFRTRVRRELNDISMIRIFKTKFRIYEEPEVVE